MYIVHCTMYVSCIILLIYVPIVIAGFENRERTYRNFPEPLLHWKVSLEVVRGCLMFFFPSLPPNTYIIPGIPRVSLFVRAVPTCSMTQLSSQPFPWVTQIVAALRVHVGMWLHNQRPMYVGIATLFMDHPHTKGCVLLRFKHSIEKHAQEANLCQSVGPDTAICGRQEGGVIHCMCGQSTISNPLHC